MTYLMEFTRILLLTLMAELLHFLLPLPVPASIYGMLLLFVLLETGWLRVEKIQHAGGFLLEIMPVMFIPAAVGIRSSFDELLPKLPAYILLAVLSTFIVMAISGLITEWFLKRKHRPKD